jgi:hypothetical protein
MPIDTCYSATTIQRRGGSLSRRCPRTIPECGILHHIFQSRFLLYCSTASVCSLPLFLTYIMCRMAPCLVIKSSLIPSVHYIIQS